MKITRLPLEQRHLTNIEMEHRLPSEYLTNRNVRAITTSSFLGINLLDKIGPLIRSKGRTIEVLEGGCGEAAALREIRKTFGGAVRLTGATLNEAHSQSCMPWADELIIGPIENHTFDRMYDFIFDFKGAAFYFPKDVIPVYGKILGKDGKALVNFNLNFDSPNAAEFFAQSNLSIVSSERTGTEYLLRSAK